MSRVPVIVQMSATECGLSCLAMVLGGLGRTTSLQELRVHFGVGRDGTNARRIVDVARTFGVTARGLRVGRDGLAELRLPAIAHWGGDHFTVVEDVGRRRVRVVDPGSGRQSMTHDEFFAKFSGTALEFTAENSMAYKRRRVRDHMALRFLRDLLRLAPALVLLGMALSAVVQLLGLASAWATKYGVDTLIGQGAQTLSVFATGVVAYVLTHALATLARGLALLLLQRRLDGALGTRFMTHLIHLPYSYFQTRGAGDLMARLGSNMAVREMLTSQLATIVLDAFLVIGYTALLLTLSPGYAAVVAVLALAQLAVVMSTIRLVHERAQRELSASANAQAGAFDALAGAEFLKSSGLSRWGLERWTERFTGSVQAGFQRRRLDLVNETAMGMFQVAAPLTLLVYGVTQVTAGTMSLGTMLSLNVVAGLLLAPIGQVLGGLRYLQTVGSHLERIYDVLDEQRERDGQEGYRPVVLGGEIEVSGVDFRYESDGPLVLHNLNFRVSAGSTVALVGTTGSGKTTIVRLLTGLLRPSAGTILVDGVPMDEYALDPLRQRFGVVTQFPYIFGGSIRDNLTLGRDGLTDDDLREALRRAQLLADLERMPLGLSTPVGEGGAALSGGQRQRLAIARALLANTNVLLFDEATSHLDTVTEAAIATELSALGCTRVVIAHRISTVVDADQILVLHQGEVVEQGTHKLLMALEGRYAALARRQAAVLPVATA